MENKIKELKKIISEQEKRIQQLEDAWESKFGNWGKVMARKMKENGHPLPDYYYQN